MATQSLPQTVSSVQSLKLFMEGVEVPCSRFSVTVGINGPATCAFAIPNTDVLTDINFEPPNFSGLQPRTVLQAFYRDGDQWKLMFEGEPDVLGEAESIASKQCMLTGVDMSNYWSGIPQYFLDKSKSGFPPGDYILGRKNASGLTVRGKPVNIQSKFLSIFRKNGLLDGVEDIFELIEGINPYYQSVEDRLKLNKRFAILENDNARQLFERASLWKDMANKLALVGGKASMMQMIMTVLEMIRYIYIPNPCYSSISSTRVNNVIFAPNVFMKIPPRCNVLFPEDYNALTPTGFAFNKIPTRLTAILQHPIKGAPYAKPKIKIFVEPDAHSDAIARRDFTYFSDEEYYRGPVRSNQVIYGNLYAQAGAKSDRYSKEAVEFDYYYQRYAHRRIQVSTNKLIPELLVGFPILIMRYPKKHLLGRLIGMTLNLTSDGKASTVLNIDCVRRYNAPEPPAFANWFQSDLYDNQYIGRSIYLENVGFNKTDKDGSIMVFETSNRTDYITAIENLCNGVDGRYDKEPNKAGFRKWFRDRHILTLKQAMEFIGAEPENYVPSDDAKENEAAFNNATLFDHHCDYRAWSDDFREEHPGASQTGPYITQRREQMLLYKQSLQEVVVEL